MKAQKGRAEGIAEAEGKVEGIAEGKVEGSAVGKAEDFRICM